MDQPDRDGRGYVDTLNVRGLETSCEETTASAVGSDGVPPDVIHTQTIRRSASSSPSWRRARTGKLGAPEQLQRVDGDVRRALVRRSPFAILCLADPESVAIIAVCHTSRDPAGWHGRVR